jgi:hypothetical protein
MAISIYKCGLLEMETWWRFAEVRPSYHVVLLHVTGQLQQIKHQEWCC